MRFETALQEERNRPVALGVVERVASANGVRGDELAPLNDVVDPDALTALARSLPAAGEITFEYEEFVVTVRGGGHIHLSQL